MPDAFRKIPEWSGIFLLFDQGITLMAISGYDIAVQGTARAALPGMARGGGKRVGFWAFEAVKQNALPPRRIALNPNVAAAAPTTRIPWKNAEPEERPRCECQEGRQ